MNHENIPAFFGWLSSVICLIFTLRCAFAFAKNQPMIFLALTVYAAQWGVLIVYYNNEKLAEFLPALSGYLCAIVGSLVYRVRLERNARMRHHLSHRESLFGWLLLTLALPEVLKMPPSLLPSVTHEDIEVIVTLLLTTIGYYSLYLAVKKICINKYLTNFVSFCLIIYWILEMSYTILWIFKKDNAMSDFFYYSFGIIKLITTFSFIPSILISISSFRKLTLTEKILQFLHIGGK